ncbi:hypothetical protein P4637_09075 [Halalkalibacterium halodurans]|jgi:hypothetical protein|uniref:BH2918 protein n=2 Tax=Halalkalibacterium halodurans TaxID=86665 RepID=Q9K8T4_HALH5|nr:hypothetical protein [Halalkalibacterium halodurans]MDY7223470.1 hypothetical protein [Halalkalibacterium halodurans]MDY7242691.1 hypothetical protein [Halalkalibacterium halodurans]MED3645335.1 hypothetical protein [Halalkalibacterium halodurans]MED4081602.1 hypothetical protein [Halalkalibacterium halodurans]MED4084986.1 hypothetical protein [Halalkalibacterium halodurans]
MKKTLGWLTGVVTIAGVTAYALNNCTIRSKLKRVVKIGNQQKKEGDKTKRISIGHPDPYDTEDNRMVEEGALYSIQHYNKKKNA